MATNPNIILAAGQGRPQSVDYNSAQNLVDADVALKAKQDQQDRQQAIQAQNAFRTALQQSGGDYDAAIAQSERQGYDMTPMRMARTKLQEEIYKAGTEQLNQHKVEDDLVGRIFNTMDASDPSSIQRGTQMLMRVDPHAGWDQIVGPNPTKEHLAQLSGLGMTAKEHADLAQKSLEAMKSGDWLGFLAAGRKSSNSPEDWQGITQVAQQLMIPKAMVDHVAQMTPDQLDEVITKGKQADEKAPKVGSFEDYVTRTYGANPTPAQILVARKAYGQADDRVHVSVTGAPGTAGGLTTGEGGGVEYAGTLTRIMGRVPVGLARSGGAATAAINEAARQTKVLGRTPIDSVLKTAVFQGDQKALANVQRLRTAADAFENKALAQLDIVDGLSDKVGRTKFPILNSAILAGKTQILGDPDATLLLNAIQTASTEYAKIVMGGTASAQALSDTAAKEAKKLLNEAMNKGTLKRATALMRTEMDLTMKGFDASEKHIMDNMGAAGGAAPSATNPADPLGILK